jgi:DNA-binding MarR family transcriptional regulator
LEDIKLITLTPLEKEYINVVSKFFELFYHTKTEAKILALFQLKGRTKDSSFSQKEIKATLGKSKATISKTMNALVERERCKYYIEEEITNFESKKRVIIERRYYAEQNFQDIIINRMNKSIEEFGIIKSRINNIKDKNINDKSNQSDFLESGTTEFSTILEKWIESYKLTVDIFKENR